MNRALRFAALGDSLSEGVGDRVEGGWRGWAALLAPALADARRGVEFRNFAVSGAQTREVHMEQLPRAVAFSPDVVSVLVGVNDTLRYTFDIRAVASRLDAVYAEFAGRGAVLLTACLPDPGTMLGLPSALGRPLARRQRSVNTVVHALSERYGAVHVHVAGEAWAADRGMWSADRLHPGELGHRMLAARFHARLVEQGLAVGGAPSVEVDGMPSRSAGVLWLATAGTGWVVRRCTDLVPQLVGLAVEEVRHRLAGTSVVLDVRAARATASAVAGVL
ncbi:SGNH/GDSL hydrolase family protein [Streptomyces sp. NPDC050418]|uniref:SGNH/GDSL hydrolase family protein n=1 Tax=Streptomyces sp. NPDC050418 TaxID=3365612 RepID=UPI0037A95489